MIKGDEKLTKIEKCEFFASWLKDNRVNHEKFNTGYHIQIQKIHNFYPSNNSYYNSETGKRECDLHFSNVESFTNFISVRQGDDKTKNQELRDFCAFQHWLGTNYTSLPTDSTEMTKRAIKYYNHLKNL